MNTLSGNIRIIGESHAGLYDFFGPIYLDSTTMHRIGRDGVHEILVAFGSRFPNAGDWLIFVVGEVDCRCHIDRQIKEQGREEDEVICTLATNYVSALVKYQKESHVRVGVRGVVPPLEFGNHHCDRFPIKGEFKDRLRYQQVLNKTLEAKCKEHGILFIPSPQWAVKEDGGMKMELSDGIIHIANSHENRTLACQELVNYVAEFVQTSSLNL